MSKYIIIEMAIQVPEGIEATNEQVTEWAFFNTGIRNDMGMHNPLSNEGIDRAAAIGWGVRDGNYKDALRF